MAINVSELNTGKLTFEGVKIKGALGGSGDGLGSDTIELVPDVDLYAAHQYLVIDPADPDHIHIRVGGDIDDSDATLILGGELSNITIDDQADAHISILSRTADNSTSHVWKFNNDGSTRFPTVDVDLLDDGVTAVEALQFANNTLYSVITGAAPTGGDDVKPLRLQGLSGEAGAAGGSIYIASGSSTGSDAGSINIKAGGSSGAGNWGGGIGLTSGSNPDAVGSDITLTTGEGSTGANSGNIQFNISSHSWQFKPDGNTTIPDLKDIRDFAGNTVISGGNRVKNYLSSAGASIPVDENNIYAINTLANATNIKLPLSTTVPIGYELTVLDSFGNAQSKNITVTVEVGDEILSAPAGITIDTNYGLLAFKYIGGKYWVILYGR